MPRLEITEDLEVQKRDFKLEKYFKYFLIGFLALALIGLFGNGPISRAETETQGFDFIYSRFARSYSPGEYRVKIKSDNPEINLLMSKEAFRYFQVEDIKPAPEIETERDGKIYYLFRIDGPQKEIVFRLRAIRPGYLRGRIELLEGQGADYWQLIYF